ncbi:hypothetical protein GSS87_02865 [Corynebacterium sp. 4HC-13]|uniref:hypothetical protein n=1 Tax=Corynebacterium anserum TaxID=2684406 RepID=UPI0016395B2A|nr:hypothetical protein [Corynebacterium anserum]MBC2681350.1 hypothetical protein [Corynebacterium anserum]
MFGLFGKKNDHDTASTGHTPAGEDNPTTVIRNGVGEAMFAALVGQQADMSEYTYAKEFLPGMWCYLAAQRNGEYHLMKDKEIPGPLDSDPFMGQLEQAPNIFHVARESTRIECEKKFTVMGVERTEIQMLTTGSPFGAVLATDMNSLLSMMEIPDYGHGHVIAMPWTNSVMVYPVQQDCNAQDLVTMSQVAMQATQNGEQPLSPFMFWYKDGKFLPLSAVQGDQLGLNIPLELPIKRDENNQPVMESSENSED